MNKVIKYCNQSENTKIAILLRNVLRSNEEPFGGDDVFEAIIDNERKFIFKTSFGWFPIYFQYEWARFLINNDIGMIRHRENGPAAVGMADRTGSYFYYLYNNFYSDDNKKKYLSDVKMLQKKHRKSKKEYLEYILKGLSVKVI